MKKRKIFLQILSLILIIIPFFINCYSIYKLISLCLGIILLTLSFILNKKINIIILVYMPILLLILTYGLDYMKVYLFNISPIYVFSNTINKDVKIYNSLFYRIYKCEDNYIFDNKYQKKFACKTDLVENIDINNLLNEPKESYKKYKNDFIKVTGKISRINGASNILLQSFNDKEKNLNGYVKFNETSKLVINLDKEDVISNYKIYDYITVVGIVSEYNSKDNSIILNDVKLEENNLYDNFDLQVIEKDNCNDELTEYSDNIYTKCIHNIYVNYEIDKYELSYAMKDGKLKYNDLINNFAKIDNVYKLDNLNIIECDNDNKIILSKNEEVDKLLCENIPK